MKRWNGERTVEVLFLDHDNISGWTRGLEHHGVRLVSVSTVADARARLDTHEPGVVLLGLDRAVADSLYFLVEDCRLRDLPTVIITDRRAPSQIVRLLALGADDVVPRSINPTELAARIRAILRRSGRGRTAEIIRHGTLAVDRRAHEVTLDGRVVELTRREYDLLVHLASHPRQAFSRDELLACVWKSSSEWQDSGTVTEHVRRLRGKLAPGAITALRGFGYRFEPTAFDRAQHAAA